MSNAKALAEAAERHRLSSGAVQALADSLARGGWGSAQWNHPDLGGMGQWSGGMLQIGDMFNDDLKGRVRAAIEDLVRAGSTADREQGARLSSTSAERGARPADWWPAELGRPSSTGSQNDMHYACFPEARRLVIRQDGRITIYDTGSHRLTGFAQSQSDRQVLDFTGPDGRIGLGDLTVVA